MAEIKKILWPTDFSRSCSMVLPRICEMAQNYDAEIEVLYIGRDLCDVEPFYGEAGEDHIKKYHDWEVKRSVKRLDESCSPEPDQCPPVTKKVVLGDAYREIMTAIETDDIDIVLFGNRGAFVRFRAACFLQPFHGSFDLPVMIFLNMVFTRFPVKRFDVIHVAADVKYFDFSVVFLGHLTNPG